MIIDIDVIGYFYQPMRPSSRALEYAVAVAETLNFREAARACHITQPALSSQIAQLEGLDQLGEPASVVVEGVCVGIARLVRKTEAE